MDGPFYEWIPELFPAGDESYYIFYFIEEDPRYLVAPFWADVDIRGEVGDISYQVYTTGSPLLDTVNTIISDEENISFVGHWMLVAEWDSVPTYPYDYSQVTSNI